MSLKLGRGTNISHWLSQSEQRGAVRRAFFTRDDVQRIADWGFDHIRLPMDEVQMWDASGKQEAEAFDLLDQALDWCHEAGLKAVVDLHILRSHFFNQSTEPPLFTDPAEATKFADLWLQLSARLSSRSNEQLAYELMNEPVAQDAGDWNRVAMTAFRAIRDREAQRTIVLGSNRWNSVTTFDQLHVPDDRYTVLSFHFYHPMLITHHQASWCPEGRMYAGPVQYPGQPIPEEHLAEARLPESGRLISLKLAELNKPYNRDSMVADLAKPLAVARRTRLPLYCGEFGVINLAPHPVRAAWYADLISVFDEYEIGWANWDYKGSFGIVDRQGCSTGIAEVMLNGCTHSSSRG
jgi:endoglucanase